MPVPGTERMKRFRIRCAGRCGGAAAAVQGGQHGQVLGESDVRHAHHPQHGRPLAQAGVEVVQAVEVAPRGLLAVGRCRHGGGTLGEHHVIAVPGQLVVMGSALDADVGVEAVERGEEVGVEEQLPLPGHRPLHGGAQGLLVLRVVGAAGLHGRAQAAQQTGVADVADEQPAAGRQQFRCRAEYLGEVVGAREVLGDGVDDDGVEVALRQPGDVVRGLGAQADPVGQLRHRLDLGAQGAYGLLGEVGAPVRLASGRDPGEDQSAADADLQDPAGRQFLDTGDAGITPLPHLVDGDGQSVVHAVPAREVLAEAHRVVPVALGSRRRVEEFMQVLPLLDLHGLVPGRLRLRLRLRLQGRNDISGQPAVAGPVLTHHDRCLVHGRVAAQYGLDLAGFDAEAADLHLGVGPAEELEAPVGLPAHQVAGAVQPLAGRPERVGDEPFGRQVRPPQVAAGQARAAEVELARHARRDGLQPGVEDVGASPGVGDTDRHDGAGGGVGIAEAEGGVGGRLGRAVRVEHHPAARIAADQLRRDAFGAGEEGGGRQFDVLGHGGEQGRREDHEGDAVGVRVLGERCARHPAFGRYDDEPATGEQSEAQVPERHVEAGRGELEHSAVRADAEPLGLRSDQLGDARVREHHALGAAGGAGGVDDVGGVAGGQRFGGGVVRRALPQLPYGVGLVEDQAVHAVARRDVGGGLGGGDQAGGGRVGEHVGDAVRRVVGVHRQVGGAGLEHGDLGDDQLGRAGHGERDDPFGSGAARDEGVGQPVGALVDLGVGQLGVLEDEGDGVRSQTHLLGEQLRPGA
ncbi:hypothetical protein GCM10010307_30950 [Streptomyces vastus]|uniref:Uncharacterized protein n=1 Tax=Streptomyces vastus TaxID=285451 RepID=A0ABP6D3Z5_9ACTN